MNNFSKKSSAQKSSVLFFSLSILKKNPLLFLPKVFVAILYGFATLWAANLAQELLSIIQNQNKVLSFAQSQDILSSAALLLLLTLITFFVDLFFSGLYPILVDQAFKGRVSWFKAFFVLKKKLWLIFSSGVVAWIIVGVFSALASAVLFFLNMNEFSWILSFAIGFIFIFFFYFLFPTVIFKESKLTHSIKDTLFESFANKRIVFLYSLIPFSVSVVKFILAFFSSTIEVLWVFWGLVIITGVIYSFHAVASQLLYERFYLARAQQTVLMQK